MRAGRLRQAGSPTTDRARRARADIAAEAGLVLVALSLAFGAGAVGYVIGRETAPSDGGEQAARAPAETQTETQAETQAETGETQTATEPAETETGGQTTTEGEGEGGGQGGDAAAGEGVFAEAGCGSCHTLEEAGSSGTVGPSLDETPLAEEEIAGVVTNGRGGMPPFEGRLSAEEIRSVAAFVAQSAG